MKVIFLANKCFTVLNNPLQKQSTIFCFKYLSKLNILEYLTQRCEGSQESLLSSINGMKIISLRIG